MGRYMVCHDTTPSFRVDMARVKKFFMSFDKVAIVEAENIDEVYRLTNHIDRAWQENPEVVWGRKLARSTSVGDVILDYGKDEAWVCDRVGWTKVLGWRAEIV